MNYFRTTLFSDTHIINTNIFLELIKKIFINLIKKIFINTNMFLELIKKVLSSPLVGAF